MAKALIAPTLTAASGTASGLNAKRRETVNCQPRITRSTRMTATP
jgi:hypothetical protein